MKFWILEWLPERASKMIIRQRHPTDHFFATTLALLAFSLGCQSSQNEYAEPPPPDVTVTHPLQQTVTQFLEENGTTEAVEQAEVRARVRGFVEEVAFDPGQEVQVGDVLYRIEKEQYEAEKNSAEATLAAASASIKVAQSLVKTAEAELTRISRELDRQKELLLKNATSQAEFDIVAAGHVSARANLHAAQAGVETAIAEQGKAAANLEQAQLDFDYTVVRAPIAGRITKTAVKKGNLVENGTVLADIVDARQVFVNFSISDREVLRYREARQAELEPNEKMKRPDLSSFPVYLRRETDQGFPFAGHLEYADVEGVDASTGTLAMRAIFENSSKDLFPGLFVRVRMPTEQREVLLISEEAVGRDQRGSFVLAIDQQNKVERKSIVTARKYDGWIVVKSGLTTSDRVVIAGIQRARPGMTVAPQEKQLTITDQSLIRGLPDEKEPDKKEPEAKPKDSMELPVDTSIADDPSADK